LVGEGELVQRGQLLIRLAAAEVQALEQTLSSQAITLLAQRARLQAEQLGLAEVVPPPEFASLPPRDRTEASAALRVQQVQLRARRQLLDAQRSVLGQRTAQSAEQGQGFGSQVTATAEQLRLISEELNSLREVAARGFVSRTRVRALERAQAELQGQLGQYRAEAARTREAGGESRLEVVQAERTHLERVATELRETETALNDIIPRLRAARDQLTRTEIRAPATGTVVGMSVFTNGGVIAAGQRLMDIVPTEAVLQIEARIAPDDADDLTTGQETRVRFSSLHDRALPDLRGVLTRISADAFDDERTGESYFTADIVVPREELRIIQDSRGEDFDLRAGMPVEVLIPVRSRTALEYLLEPLTGSFWRSFREQ
jgi:HlyD family secretion protein